MLQDPFEYNLDVDLLDPEEDTNNLFIELSNGIVIKRRKNPQISHHRNSNRNTEPENYYRERLMLFLHCRKEETDFQAGITTYQGHFKAREDEILPIQLKYE